MAGERYTAPTHATGSDGAICTDARFEELMGVAESHSSVLTGRHQSTSSLAFHWLGLPFLLRVPMLGGPRALTAC